MPAKTFIDSCEEIEGILRRETLGFLGVSVDDTPYVVPLTYCYADGKIIFHGSRTGKRLDYIRENERVCFTVARQAGPPAPPSAGRPLPVRERQRRLLRRGTNTRRSGGTKRRSQHLQSPDGARRE